MKFCLFFLPALPATLDERLRLRPIANLTERWQQMIGELVELARMADDLGFEMAALPEHYLHTEGLEMGSTPPLFMHLIDQTSRIKVGPIGYVLPSWNPLRLAATVGWLDQLSKGRTFVGFARGYQTRWFNPMAQRMGVVATVSDQSQADLANRRLFEEVYRVLKLAWADEAFSFKGEFWQYPFPYDEGTPWAASPWTEEYGAPGEMEHGRVRKISVVPKPYQKPYPPLFQAFSVSEATIKWAAREDIIPMTLIPKPQAMRRAAEVYQAECAVHGRKLALGERIGASHQIYIGRDQQEAFEMARHGTPGVLFRKFWGYFGFCEAFRMPEDETRWPKDKMMLPESEWTVERMARCSYLFGGTLADVRRKMDEMVETSNPEYFQWASDQGLLPLEVVKQQLRIFGEQIMPHYR